MSDFAANLNAVVATRSPDQQSYAQDLCKKDIDILTSALPQKGPPATQVESTLTWASIARFQSNPRYHLGKYPATSKAYNPNENNVPSITRNGSTRNSAHETYIVRSMSGAMRQHRGFNSSIGPFCCSHTTGLDKHPSGQNSI
ncbi:hypothetical protein DID88_010200 [Monilinia fructigena]|uniref:Uncharacterized protein n=1 Tax=Monilinia fructigena TaxID=38457 RepID=A0A395IL51_9HELO|nr:hypothetical protein DID88_010200 [Monilinia fructigena]